MPTSPAAHEEQILLFTRYPAPGQVKTRLVPVLGPHGAAALQRRLTERTLARIRALQQRRPVGLEVRATGGSRERFAKWLGSAKIVPQGRGGLGARLRRAFEAAFGRGAKRAVAVGADCPALSPEVLARAFEELHRKDVVLGPAMDGGYYLVGLSRPAPALFAAIPWGTSGVLAATLARAAAGSLSVSLLEPLADVDRPEDLPHLEPVGMK
ncbi:MAG: TIGR04282 family arsenosugar biosynthesis glycosyltransferase [Desulfobacteraceae bacterium]|nr:TIGR04282 family arsenosugar biosynthesis glycosyltransferase [Desulfobacteraceae bacterium]